MEGGGEGGGGKTIIIIRYSSLDLLVFYLEN